jgi:hypothetical protein
MHLQCNRQFTPLGDIIKGQFEQQKIQNFSELRTFTRTLNKFRVFLEMATLQVVDSPVAKFGIAATFSERILGQLFGVLTWEEPCQFV